MKFRKWFPLVLMVVFILTVTSCGKTEPLFVKAETLQEVIIDESTTYTIRNAFAYDKEGQFSETRTYMDDALQAISTVEEKTAEGAPKLVYNRDADGNVEEAVYTAYQNGKPVTVEHERDGFIYQTARMTYDAKGNILSSENQSGDGEVLSRVTYSYDENGILQTVTRDYQSAGVVLEVYEYDAEGRTAKVTVYEGNSVDAPVREYVEYSYSADGLTCTQVTTPVSGISGESTLVTTYDEHGNEVKRENFANGVLVSRFTTRWEKVG